MPTRQGWTIAAGAVAALVIGRVFGILELFVLGAGLGTAVIAGVLAVRLRRPALVIARWVHPSVLTVGDTGRVDLGVRNDSPYRSPRVDLAEPVGPINTARMTLTSLLPGDQVTAGYRIPATRRGVLTLGPLEIERRDQLGLAVLWSIGAGVTDVMVAPRTVELSMPALGHGVLGRHLMAQAQRLGPGEFHALRDYIDGDEPRSIHWKASARSEQLKVREHTAEGVRRCIIVLDRDESAYDVDADEDVFERAIVAAGSLVQGGVRGGLTTRFVTGGGIDLRGPEVATQTLRVLAPLQLGEPIVDLERDPGEGLGLVIVVTSSRSAAAWRRAEQLIDPTLTRVGVFTAQVDHGRLSVDATSIENFQQGWEALAGVTGLSARDRRFAPGSPDAARAPTGPDQDPDRPWRKVAS
jgi:uncharacterized protein (DUF58 family)